MTRNNYEGKYSCVREVITAPGERVIFGRKETKRLKEKSDRNRGKAEIERYLGSRDKEGRNF